MITLGADKIKKENVIKQSWKAYIFIQIINLNILNMLNLSNSNRCTFE